MAGQKSTGIKYVKINKGTHKRKIVKKYTPEKVQNPCKWNKCKKVQKNILKKYSLKGCRIRI